MRAQQLSGIAVLVLAATCLAAKVDVSAWAAPSKPQEIVAPGTPGSLAVWGSGTALAITKSEGDTFEPVAARWTAPAQADGQQPGGLYAFAHTGYLSQSSLATLDTRAFLEEHIRASIIDPRLGKGKPKVALIHCDLGGFLTELGCETVDLTKTKDSEWAGKLGNDQVAAVFIVGNNFGAAGVSALAEFVRNGGQVFAAQTAWAWQAPAGFADQSLRANPLNRLAASVEAPIGWTGAYTSKATEHGALVLGEIDPLKPLLNGDSALDYLASIKPGDKSGDRPDGTSDQAALTVLRAAVLVPLGPSEDVKSVASPTVAVKPLGARLTELAATRTAGNISKAKPLTNKQPLDRVALAVAIVQASSVSADQVKAHPSAATFPGPVPAASTTPRVSKTFVIDNGQYGWKSTGLYAAPGEVVIAELVDGTSTTENLSIRIGCHTDHLYHHDKWWRAPEIAHSWAIRASEPTKVASAFGGLLYIDVPERKAKAAISSYSVRVSGGVINAPLYIRGTTTRDQWQAQLAETHAPWGELATSKVILSIPIAELRKVDDPAPLMELWDRVLDAAADLATIPHDRQRPERYVPDVQISAGYMHSGYPIMTHLDAAEDMSGVDNLKAGAWGLFHELGHNHQESEWTFNGTVEVTVNLFSLYVMETVCGKPMHTGHPALEKRNEAMQRFIETKPRRGDRFEKWKSDPFLALHMYMQLREAFGWETYKRVFAEYRSLPGGERPKGEEQQRDQWMVRFSKAAGKNLGPFFTLWGVPTSQGARDSIAHLPVWMPDEMDGLIRADQRR